MSRVWDYQVLHMLGRYRAEDLSIVALMYVEAINWESGNGIPHIDGLRPFNDLNWELDILAELEIEPADSGHYSDEQRLYVKSLLRAVPGYLQNLCALQFTTKRSGKETTKRDNPLRVVGDEHE